MAISERISRKTDSNKKFAEAARLYFDYHRKKIDGRAAVWLEDGLAITSDALSVDMHRRWCEAARVKIETQTWAKAFQPNIGRCLRGTG